MDEKKSTRREELDDFWEIDDLIPKKKPLVYVSDTTTAEIVLPSDEEATPTSTKIPPRQQSASFSEQKKASLRTQHLPKPELEYETEHPLLRKVRVYRWKSDYSYYEAFYRDAVKLYPIRGEECPRVPFFSYVPQYSQLSRQQLEWYLWWREQFRNGVCADTDYSYLLLYVYELLNLSHNTSPLLARDALCKIWTQYRKTFHQLDCYLPEWICDMSLLHRLPPPEFEDTRLQSLLLSHCSLKEFYVLGNEGDGYLRALLTLCSNYDYRKSKFYTQETKDLFDSVIMKTLQEISTRTEESGKPFAKAKLDQSKVMRNAYMGALCSERIRKRIEVEYCSFSRSHELRFLITDIVKYTENQIRAALGIRSRLGIYALPFPIRTAIDAYLPSVLPVSRRHYAKHTEQESPSYERLYDPPKGVLSFEAAERIERLSWETTERLVEAFEDGEKAEAEDVFTENPLKTANTFDEPSVKNTQADASSDETMKKSKENTHASSPFAPYAVFLRAVMAQNIHGQREAAKAAGKSLEVFADELNALSAEKMGDILVEEADVGYCVIEDYEEWLADLLLKL